MENHQIYIIDFDSTFTKVEALDELAAIALQGKPNQKEIFDQIVAITNAGMEGKMTFDIALQKRIDLLQANKTDIENLVLFLKQKITSSFERNQEFIRKHAEQIHIVSGGFKEYITPIVMPLGVLESNIHANTFSFDTAGNIIGFDTENLLSKAGGKVKLLQKLQLKGECCIIGDGYTDYEIKEAGLANTFYMFAENVRRESLVPKADSVIGSLDEFLYMNKLSRSQSYPKNRIKVLILENIHANAQHIFGEEGFELDIRKEALNEDELIEAIKDVHVLCIRSKTFVSAQVLQKANRLMAIGAFCIGTNQIDQKACAEKGIPIFNAPYSNTRSVVELTIAEIIFLLRNIATKSDQMHQGIWDKSANNSFEVRGKILGIIGYGNIGSQLSVLAEAMGMKVCFYDIGDKLALGNARKYGSLKEVLQQSDIVSLHVDGRAENKHLIDATTLAQMKNGAILINNARGHVVDITALREAIISGKIAGTAVDVFDYEPAHNDEKFDNALVGLRNVILTPHIGGSTEEAQANIGDFVPHKLLGFINKGDTYGSVNFPEVQLPAFSNAHRILHIHKNVPGILAKINNIFAEHNVNIEAQYLKTNEQIGYVITDIAKDYSDDIIEALKAIPNTIKFRMLY